MSEDVKPRQYFIVESENYNKPPYLDSHRAYHCKQALYENIPVIELEPMLQLMKEMGEALDEVRFHEQHFVDNLKEALKDYRGMK